MGDRDILTRRRALRRGAAAALGVGGLASGAAAAEGDGGADTDGGLLSVLDGGPTQIPLLEIPEGVETATPSLVPERASGIRPGSQLFVEHEQGTASCSANFLWRDGNTGKRYLGAAGHCFLGSTPAAEGIADGDGADVSGLTVSVAVDAPIGGLSGQSLTDVEVVELGDVVYARQAEPGGGAGVGHDFGLVEIPESAAHLVDPSLPQFGGPDGIVREGAPSAGTPVVQYGAGIVNGELYLTQARRGLSLGSSGSYRSWVAVLRATPGDSGSALLAAELGAGSLNGGPAAGVLTHVTSSGIMGTTVQRCKEMVREDGLGMDLEVVQP